MTRRPDGYPPPPPCEYVKRGVDFRTVLAYAAIGAMGLVAFGAVVVFFVAVLAFLFGVG